MKKWGCFLVTCLLMCKGNAQPFITDRVHPLLTQPGDSIRQYFSMTKYSFPGPQYYNPGQGHHTSLTTPYLAMTLYYSNKLAINHRVAVRKIPALKEYANDSAWLDQYGQYQYSGKYAIPVFDSTGVVVTVQGINPQNADRYEFRVLKNKTEVVIPWRTPSLFSKWFYLTRIADPKKQDMQDAYLGQFKTTNGNSLTFEVREKNSPDLIQVRQTALWVDRSPRIVATFTTDQMPAFLETFKRQWKQPQLFEVYEDWVDNDSLPKLKKEFRPDENSLIFYLDDIVKSKEIIEYNLVHHGDSTGWKANDFDLNFIWLKNLAPGDYQLKIRFSVQRHNSSVYTFTILPAWYQTLLFRIGAGIVAMIFLALLYILYLSGKQKARLKNETLQKQRVQAELKSIRSQFNPHFVFNSLNSIQNLVLNKDVDAATRYLADFSTLMRDSLNAGNREMVSIREEMKMLKSYLELEQLRFGFSYQFATDNNLNVDATDIPALLLQPLVENAIKHGIAGLYEKGKLEICFEKTTADLLIRVIDNGKGFDPGSTEGYGLKLTRDRIHLLNETLQEQALVFVIPEKEKGAEFILHFKNWFL